MEPPDFLSRRDALKATIASIGLSSLAFEPAQAASTTTPDARRGSTKRYDMLKSINLWAFPYPERMTLRECLQLAKDAGFDGIELNYDLDNELSPKHGTADYVKIRKMADAFRKLEAQHPRQYFRLPTCDAYENVQKTTDHHSK